MQIHIGRRFSTTGGGLEKILGGFTGGDGRKSLKCKVNVEQRKCSFCTGEV